MGKLRTTSKKYVTRVKEEVATGAAADSPAASFRVRAARHLMGKRVRTLLQPQGHQGHHAECPGFEVQNQIYQRSHFKFKV